ncbi:hypothetical protein C8Q73DRAFT_725992, partial [Cubamyces lactineus]
MVNVMDTELWKQIHTRLEPAQASDKTLRMANGATVKSQGKWRGLFDFQGVHVNSAFEIFPSQGAWSFLIGKPLLEALKATHDYESDQIIVSNDRYKTVIENQRGRTWGDRALKHKGLMLTLDAKMCHTMIEAEETEYTVKDALTDTITQQITPRFKTVTVEEESEEDKGEEEDVREERESYKN